MATRKSTTKAKTKSSPSKARSTKTTSTITKKPVKTSAASVPKRAGPAVVNILRLRRIMKISVGLYALLAIAAGTLMNDTSRQLTVGYLTSDSLASKTTAVFAPAMRVLYDLELRWALLALLAFSLVTTLLYLTRMEQKYAESLRGRVLPWRWLDIAVSGAIMVEIVALLSGVQDLMTIKLMVSLVALGSFLSWIAERQNSDAKRPILRTYLAALISWTLPLVVILVYTLGTPFYGMVRSPWYVYALDLVLVFGFAMFARNQYNQYSRKGDTNDYMGTERNYLMINLLTKAAFAIVLIIGLRR